MAPVGRWPVALVARPLGEAKEAESSGHLSSPRAGRILAWHGERESAELASNEPSDHGDQFVSDAGDIRYVADAYGVHRSCLQCHCDCWAHDVKLMQYVLILVTVKRKYNKEKRTKEKIDDMIYVDETDEQEEVIEIEYWLKMCVLTKKRKKMYHEKHKESVYVFLHRERKWMERMQENNEQAKSMRKKNMN